MWGGIFTSVKDLEIDIVMWPRRNPWSHFVCNINMSVNLEPTEPRVPFQYDLKISEF